MCGTNRNILLLREIAETVTQAAEALIKEANLKPRQVIVLGCSTSEVMGERIGKASNPDVAAVIVGNILQVCKTHGIFLAVQCCEHLNRALVVEREAAELYGWEEVTVVPVLKAGGGAATAAREMFEFPVVVEEIRAHAGIDIGDTIIGMHLRKVAVPLRLPQRKVGHANLVLVRTRPKLIGGERAVYSLEQEK